MSRLGQQHERLTLLWAALYLGVAVLGARLLHVQVMRNVYYSRVAESQRTRIIPQTAPRGKVFDREGKLIAANRPAFSLIYLPGEKKDAAMLAGLSVSLAKELHRDEGELLNSLKEAQREESAVRLAENLPLQAMFRLSELKTIFPGVDLIVEARRDYPNGAFASHLLGYMGKMDKRKWRTMKSGGYRVDSWVGQAGVESLYEDHLRGVDGEIRMEVDAHGRLKRRLGESPWEPGSNVHLTIDSKIQQAVEDALIASPSGKGAAVVLDPRNGEVLALASIPEFDPNLFLLPEWDEAREEIKRFPAFNRAVSGTYAPASTFKMIVAAAFLQEAKIDPKETVFCPGFYTIGKRPFGCWEKKGHKRVNWWEAIIHSCDVYFYRKGLAAGGAVIEAYALLFGLGERTGIDFVNEKRGNMFGPEARKKRGRGWYDGDTANQAIGQGELLATPVQMAVAMAAVANRGTLWKPRFTSKVVRPDGSIAAQTAPEAVRTIDLPDAVWDEVQTALYRVVSEGTGRRVGWGIKDVKIAGKTGTSQNPHGDDHAWFVAFAGKPDEPPSLALSILVENGGHGSSAAGPVARKAIEAAFGIVPPAAAVKKSTAAAAGASPAAPAEPAPVFVDDGAGGEILPAPSGAEAPRATGDANSPAAFGAAQPVRER